MSEKIRYHVYVEGRVQGVGFRASVKNRAQVNKVEGWVKNLYDGRVEAVLAGEKDNVESIVDYMKKGPTFARVEDVDITKEEYNGDLSGFQIKY